MVIDEVVCCKKLKETRRKMESINVLIIIIFFVIAIYIETAWAKWVNSIIRNKGYHEDWFWIAFFFPWPALIYALSKPESRYKNDYYASTTHLSRVAESVVPENGWKCIKCGRGNAVYVGTCACGNTKFDNKYVRNSNKKTAASEIDSKKLKQISVADEISKFKKLLDEGVISAEEFEKKKKQLLDM